MSGYATVCLNWEYDCIKLMVAFAILWDLIVVFLKGKRISVSLLLKICFPVM